MTPSLSPATGTKEFKYTVEHFSISIYRIIHALKKTTLANSFDRCKVKKFFLGTHIHKVS